MTRVLSALFLVLGTAGVARAQMPTVDPDGTLPAPAGPAAPAAGGGGQTYYPGQPTPPAGGQTVTPGPNGNVRIQLVAPGDKSDKGEEKEPDPMILGPHGQHGTPNRPSDHWNGGPVPETHVVQRGDTLWDLCTYYFGDPWRWPEIWSYNPTITNPHWIYPGNVVRLMQGSGPVAATPDQPTPEPVKATPQPTGGVELRQIAFVTLGDLKESGIVNGSTEEKEMLSEGDQVYIDYAAGKPPQVGARYSVYAPTSKIIHPVTKQEIGAFVVIRGDTKILDVKKGKQARGVINYVTMQGVVERGDRVGPLKTQFKAVTPVAPTKNLEGLIVGLLGADELIGQGHIVLIDRGKGDGLVLGNTMSVVRRGDAYAKQLGPASPAGMNDPRFPDRYIADVIIVDVGQSISVGLVTRTDKEILIGDRVLMRSSK